ICFSLSIAGAYLAMAEPFSKGGSIRVKIRTNTEFFQADATVMHSTHGLGMGAMFHAVSPPFLIVLQRWLSEAQQEVTALTKLRAVGGETPRGSFTALTRLNFLNSVRETYGFVLGAQEKKKSVPKARSPSEN